MTDISKYKNVSLSKETYLKIDKIRRVLVPNTVISRSQTINILVNEKASQLNGKLYKIILICSGRKRSYSRTKVMESSSLPSFV